MLTEFPGSVWIDERAIVAMEVSTQGSVYADVSVLMAGGGRVTFTVSKEESWEQAKVAASAWIREWVKSRTILPADGRWGRLKYPEDSAQLVEQIRAAKENARIAGGEQAEPGNMT
jgi:hypothetical protein